MAKEMCQTKYVKEAKELAQSVESLRTAIFANNGKNANAVFSAIGQAKSNMLLQRRAKSLEDIENERIWAEWRAENEARFWAMVNL